MLLFNSQTGKEEQKKTTPVCFMPFLTTPKEMFKESVRALQVFSARYLQVVVCKASARSHMQRRKELYYCNACNVTVAAQVKNVL